MEQSPKKSRSSSSESGSWTTRSEGSPKTYNGASRDGEDHNRTAAGAAEHAPLLSSESETLDQGDSQSLDEDMAYAFEDYSKHTEETKSQWYLLALTLSIGG